MDDKDIFVNTLLPSKTDLILRRIAAEKRVSRSEVVRIAIDEYVKQFTIVGVEKLEGPDGADRPVLVLVEEKK